jgi:hypothetical protein
MEHQVSASLVSQMYSFPSKDSADSKSGNSVMCHVTGFLPYFYIPAPIGFQREQLKAFQVVLEVRPTI